MAPNGFVDVLQGSACISELKENEDLENLKPEVQPVQVETQSQRQPLKYAHIFGILLLHSVALYAVLFDVFYHCTLTSAIFCTIYGGLAGFGVTAGAHRLWAHKTYKAKLPIRIFLAMCFSAAGQNTIPQWVLDHRVHHKFSETDADPHNSNRGFFFAHVGWLMQKKHPQVLAKGKTVDISDLHDDPVVVYHTKYFIPLKMIFCFALPIWIGHSYFGLRLVSSVLGNLVRYCCSLNFTWLVNSAAHIYGTRPFSTQIRPAENLAVSIVALGEGWHNYHHVFPWDYKAAETGHFLYNLTTFILDFFASLGLVYDRKSASPELIEKVSKKYGDGTRASGSAHDHGHLPEVDEYGCETGTGNVGTHRLKKG